MLCMWQYAINAWELARSRRRTSGFPKIRKIGYPEIPMSGCPDVRISGKSEVNKSRFRKCQDMQYMQHFRCFIGNEWMCACYTRMTKIIKIIQNGLILLEMGWESIHLKPTVISNRLQALPDPKTHRKIPKNPHFPKNPKSENPGIRRGRRQWAEPL